MGVPALAGRFEFHFYVALPVQDRKMAESEIKPLVEINRPSPNYPLMVIGGFVFVCLLASIALAFQAEDWSVMIISVFALIGAVAYAYFKSMRKPVGLERRLEWLPAQTEVQKQ